MRDEDRDRASCAHDGHASTGSAPRAARGARVALVDIDLVILAIRLAIEAGRDGSDAFSTHDLESPKAVISELILQAVPEVGDRAEDLAHTMCSLIITAAATKDGLSRGEFWRQAVMVLRAYLTDAGVDPVRFDEVFAVNDPHSCPSAARSLRRTPASVSGPRWNMALEQKLRTIANHASGWRAVNGCSLASLVLSSLGLAAVARQLRGTPLRRKKAHSSRHEIILTAAAATLPFAWSGRRTRTA